MIFGLAGAKATSVAGLRLGGAIAALVAVIAAITWLVALVRSNDRLTAYKANAEACAIAVKQRGDTTANCPQAISDAAARAARYLACDAAIATADAYNVAAACSAAVKRRDAEATAAAADLADTAAQLVAARAATTAAIARADARAKTLARKDRHAHQIIAAVPRSADGRLVCDDRCLRDLAGN